MYFESHAHYDDRRFANDRDPLLRSLKEKGVDTIINVGVNMKSSQFSIKLANQYDFVYASVGVHPHDAKTLKDSDIPQLMEWASHKKVIAIGEIGLDFHYDHSPRDTQRFWFKKQLKLVNDTNLPVIIHSREAAQETFDIIKASGVKKGVIHCYSGSAEMALDYIKIGFHIGVGGVVTYPTAKKLQEVVLEAPIEKILIETDAPYLTPVPNRGSRNDSHNLKYIVDEIGKIKQTPSQSVAKITKENAMKLFNLK